MYALILIKGVWFCPKLPNITVVGSVLLWMQNDVCHYKVQVLLPFKHCNLFLLFALKASKFFSIGNSLIRCYLGLSCSRNGKL